MSKEAFIWLPQDSGLTMEAFGWRVDATVRDNIDELMAELKRQLS